MPAVEHMPTNEPEAAALQQMAGFAVLRLVGEGYEVVGKAGDVEAARRMGRESLTGKGQIVAVMRCHCLVWAE
jgi:hypothetical protein